MLEKTLESRRYKPGKVIKSPAGTFVISFEANNFLFAIDISKNYIGSTEKNNSDDALRLEELSNESYKQILNYELYKSSEIFQQQPGATLRENLRESYFSGVPAIDLLFPVGRGQNLLLVDSGVHSFTDLVSQGILKNTFVFDQAILVEGKSNSSTFSNTKNISCLGSNYKSNTDEECRYYIDSFVAASFSSHDANNLVIFKDFHLLSSLWKRAEVLVEMFTGKSVSIDRSSLRHFYSSLIQRSAKFKSDFGDGSLTFLQCFSIFSEEHTNLHVEELKSLSDGQIVNQTVRGVTALDIKNSFSRIGVGTNRNNNKDIRYNLISTEFSNFRLRFLSDLDEATFTGVKNSSLLWRYIFNLKIHVSPKDILTIGKLIERNIIKSTSVLEKYCERLLFQK